MTQTKLEGSCTLPAKAKELDPWASDSVEEFQKLFKLKYGREATTEDINDFVNWGTI